MKSWMKILLPLVVLAIAGGGAMLLVRFAREVKPVRPVTLPPLVETVTAHKTDHQFRVQTQGTVQPRTEIQLAAEISGRVRAVSPSLASGGFFAEDDTLVEIDARDFELAVITAQARVEESRFRLALEEAEAEVARREWDRLGSGEPNDLLLRKPQLAQARAMLAGAEAGLEQARRDLDRCVIRAPFAGRVGEKLVDAGQFVARGSPVARIYSVDYAEVRLPLAADQLAYVDLPLDYRGEERPDLHPRVLLRAALGGRTHQWEGVVDRVEGEIDLRSRMLFLVARVEDPYGRTTRSDRPPLASGLFVEAEILGRTVQDVFVLPRTALRGSNTVLVVDANLQLWPREVELARAERRDVVITSGLEHGERVCISPLDVSTPGMRVRTGERPPAPPAAKPVEAAGHE